MEFLGLRRGGNHARETAIDLLARVNIPSPEEMLRRYPIELSGGMRQRVLIAMALIGHPILLIADEPTTALDVTIQKGIIEIIEEKVKEENLAVLYITHNLGVARRLSRRIYVMYAGNIVETGLTEELIQRPAHPYTTGLIESLPRLTGGVFRGIDGRIPDYISPPQGCRFYPRCLRVMEICRWQKPRLVQLDHDHFVACHLNDSGGHQ